MKQVLCCASTLVFLIGIGFDALAAAPLRQFPYSKQTNLVPGAYKFVFSLYSSPTAPAALWSSETVPLTLRTPVLLYALGSGTVKIPATIDFSQQLYVKVVKTFPGPVVVVANRERLPIVPYALWSVNSETASWGGSIREVLAGDGLTGGGSAGSVPLAVGAGTGISVEADAVSVDASVIQRRVEGECSPGAAIRAIAADGTVACETTGGGSHDPAYVNVTGDTMTGALALPANGLTAGTSQFVLSDGRVGVGTSTPLEMLEVNGAVRLPETAMIRSSASRLLHNSGTRNFFAGAAAGPAGAGTGTDNTGLGYQALAQMSSGSRNTAVGAGALAASVGGTVGGFGNTAIGAGALASLAPFEPGSGDDGQENTAVGAGALAALKTGGENVALGAGALPAGNGSGNCALGYKALENNISSGNVAVGHGAGRGEVGDAGYSNTYLGFSARPALSGLINAAAIGANATVGASNSLALGGTGSDAVNVGIGTATPKKRLHLVNGDIFLDASPAAAQGIILRAADNAAVCMRITVSSIGALYANVVACP